MDNTVRFERVLDNNEFTWELVVLSHVVGRSATELRTGNFFDFEEMAAHWRSVFDVYYVEFRTIAPYMIGARVIMYPGDGSMLDMIDVAYIAGSMGFTVGLPSIRIVGGKVDMTFDMTSDFDD